MYDVWYNVLTQKNWTCTSELMQDPLSEQLRKRNATVAKSACDYPPTHESLDTTSTDRLDSISALRKLYAVKICSKDGTMIYCTTSRTYRQTLTQKSYFSALVTACTAPHRKAVATW